MSETFANPELSLTMERRAQLLLAQRQLLSLQVSVNNAKEAFKQQLTNMLEEISSATKEIQNYVEAMATEMGIDRNKYMFSLDELVFKPVENKTE